MRSSKPRVGRAASMSVAPGACDEPGIGPGRRLPTELATRGPLRLLPPVKARRRWLEARERRDQARQVVERMEARVMKRPPRAARARPGAVPGGGRGEDQTGSRRSAGSTWSSPYSCWWSWCSATAASCTAAASQVSCSSSVNRGYSAGSVFALMAWAGVAASVVYLLNAFFGERFERRCDSARQAPSCSPAAGTVPTRVHNTAALVYLLHRTRPSAACCGCGACTCTSPTTTRPMTAARAASPSAPGVGSCWR